MLNAVELDDLDFLDFHADEDFKQQNQKNIDSETESSDAKVEEKLEKGKEKISDEEPEEHDIFLKSYLDESILITSNQWAISYLKRAGSTQVMIFIKKISIYILNIHNIIKNRLESIIVPVGLYRYCIA